MFVPEPAWTAVLLFIPQTARSQMSLHHTQPSFLEMGSQELLPRVNVEPLALIREPHLCLPSNYDYRQEPLLSSLITFETGFGCIVQADFELVVLLLHPLQLLGLQA
jgi:hypothetical protein